MRKKNVFGLTNSQLLILGVLFGINLCVIGFFSIIILRNLEYSPPQYVVTNKDSTATAKPTTVPIDNGIIGIWDDNWVAPCTIVIEKKNGIYQITRTYKDGSGYTAPLTVKVVNGEMRLFEYHDSLYGDYMVILSNGDLAFYDNEGFIYKNSPSR